MPTSTMLQLKISATKKRLFEGFLPPQVLSVVALSGLACVVASMIRVISAGGSFTVVPLDIPIVSAPVSDRSVHGFREKVDKTLMKSTLAVTLTPREFIYGDISAFTSNVADMQNKFVVLHEEGSPQVTKLLEQVNLWQDDRARRLSIRPDGVLVLIPDSRVPLNIIIRVSKLLRESKKFDSVILAGGMI
ncbi:MAG: hypothetical protein NT027_17700 [Proteobacteria bacterium]|nr:hypothetical protein [Pseudomonadota bacterium]